MSSFAPGQRIEARCTRCRDVTGHVIVALVEGQVAKVECCACGSLHKYYPPEAPAKARVAKPVRVQSGRERGEAVLEQARKTPRAKSTTPKVKLPTKAEQQSARAQAELERQWSEAIARNPGKPANYAMSGNFPLGSLVDHPTFGMGMVLALTPPDKMEVLFREGIKALRCQC